ncbi:MAG: DUF6786 family protein [Chitinophagaceae bacterium]
MNRSKPAIILLYTIIAGGLYTSCNNASMKDTTAKSDTAFEKGTYAYDAAFLRQHTGEALELNSPDGMGKVLLSAQYQGRVMTSTASGDSGASFGWLNYDLIAAKEKRKQFNPVGGEERFWMGPEGGQYSIYFKKNDSFNISHWQVPSFLDTDTYQVIKAGAAEAVFSARASFDNYSGAHFSINIERKIRLLTKEALQQSLKTVIPDGIHYVGFETVNTITNTGAADWTKENGLLSVWLLGMFTPGPETKVIIPFHPIPHAKDYITSNYFGEIPAERLQVTDSALYFTCDGKFRSKIGISPLIAKPIAGAFDFQKNVLSIVIPQVDREGAYVNSKWELQKEPYKGDVINSYNDGPLGDGTQMGPFLEIESSSAALVLKKSQSGSYRQTTCHFQGDYTALQSLAKQLLGVDLDEVKNKY